MVADFEVSGLIELGENGKIRFPRKYRIDADKVFKTPDFTIVYQGEYVQFYNSKNPHLEPNFASFKIFGEDPEYYRIVGVEPYEMVHKIVGSGGF